MIQLGPSGWAIIGFIAIIISIAGSHLLVRWQRGRALYGSLSEPYDQRLAPKNGEETDG